MTVLVTGGAGFIGTNLIKRLLSDGHEVVSIDNYTTGFESNHQKGARYVSEDVKNVKFFNVYGKFDIVYHLAAIARIQPSFKHPVEYFETNVNGTLNVVEFCSKNNIPLVYAGSSSHHGGKFMNPYTFTKDIGEEIIKLYEEHYNLKCSTARFYNVYGPHQLVTGEYSTVIGKWEEQFNNNQPITIYGKGNKRRDFTHVNDIVDGLIKIIEKMSWGYTFEFGRGESYSLNEVADIFGGERIYLDDKPGETKDIQCENFISRLILDWYPKINLRDYIKTKKGL